jgi:hypothetical protein
MDEKTARRDQFNLWPPFFASIGALLLFLPVMIYGGDSDMLYFLIAIPVSIFILAVALVYAIRKKGQTCITVLSMLVVYWAFSWGLIRNSIELHGATQWLLQSKNYKARILGQTNPAIGELSHIEWDHSGFAGSGNTVVYLVFDPSDSLSTAAKSRFPGKFRGIPCEVYRVRRLESHYYTVLFYTNTDWGHCE